MDAVVAIGLAGNIISFLSVSSSLFGAVTSTQYDIERISRSVKDILEDVRAVEHKVNIYRDAVGSLEKSAELSRHYVCLGSEMDATCRQISGSKFSLPQRLVDLARGGSDNSRGYLDGSRMLWIDAIRIDQNKDGDTCAGLKNLCRMDDIRLDPAFWRLQRWTMVSI
jgi:hypothetical protein